MLVVETIANIRRAYFVQSKALKAISRELKISRKVMRKVIRSGATAFAYERTGQPHRIIGDLLAAEINEFVFTNTPINETLVRDLAGGGFLASQRNLVLVDGTGGRFRKPRRFAWDTLKAPSPGQYPLARLLLVPGGSYAKLLKSEIRRDRFHIATPNEPLGV